MQTKTETVPPYEMREYLARKRREYGACFDPSDLDERFARYFRTGVRIKVEIYGQIKTGTVGVTTGWKPAFLLMRSSRAHGSSDVLGPSTKLIAVKVGRSYHDVTS